MLNFYPIKIEVQCKSSNIAVRSNHTHGEVYSM
jgi:hypothetical protein